MSRLYASAHVARGVVRETRRHQVPFLAAALAFYGFVSIIPLLLLSLAIGGILGIPIGQVTLELTGQLLTPSAQSALLDAMADRSGSGGAGIVGLAVLTWSGLKIFRGLDTAFSLVYGDSRAGTFLEQLGDATLVLVTIAIGIGASAALGVVLPLVLRGRLLFLVSPVLLLGTLVAVFLPMFYRFPDQPVTVKEVLPGSLFAAVGWSLLALGFGVYAGSIGSFEVYGILGAGLLLVTWMYLGGIIIMVGAVVNAVLAGRTADDTDRTDSVDTDGQEVRPETDEWADTEEVPERDDGTDTAEVSETDEGPDTAAVAREVSELRAELERKTVDRSELEADLRRYVRRRMRRGKARGWGPYVVLLYGTVMTLGAFYWLSGGWAILAMIVVWLSTLGLYVLFVLFGVGIGALGVPGSLLDRLRERRS